ncbi:MULTISPECIES: hypothetical protein [Asaia]|nr:MULTISPECIES: hypothetical protein [Asaia]
MRGGFESRDVLRFPFERQYAPTIDNLRRALPEDRAIRSLQYRFGQKRVTRATIFQISYKDEMARLHRAEPDTDPHAVDFDLEPDPLFADGVNQVFRMLGEAQRAHDELAYLTRQAVDAITAKGRFEAPDPRVEEADFRLAGLVVHSWAAGIEMLGRYRAVHDWYARVANDPFPAAKRKKSSRSAPKTRPSPKGGTK